MPACLTRRLRCSGYRLILGFSVEMRARSQSVDRVQEVDLSCCKLWPSVAISAIRSLAMLVGAHVIRLT